MLQNTEQLKNKIKAHEGTCHEKTRRTRIKKGRKSLRNRQLEKTKKRERHKKRVEAGGGMTLT